MTLRDPSSFHRALRAWYRRNARPLPWRASPSLYRTVVSEFMLQQTQVNTVLPYFERWMKTFPSFQALAAASESRVLKLWEGLGYYSRARNLHRLARAVVAMPEPPRSLGDWLALPGIGPYSAAAITSISFGARAACVDGNVVRVLTRITGDRRRFRNSADAAKQLTPLAVSLLPAKNPGDHNQSMMELGATVCTRANPRCLACPVKAYCVSFRTGRPDSLPRFAPKQVEARIVVRLWCVDKGRLLLHRIPKASRRLAGQHELPLPEHLGVTDAAAARLPLLARHRRSITRYRITESIRSASAMIRRSPGGRIQISHLKSKIRGRGPMPSANGQTVWVPFGRLSQITLSGPHRRWIGELLAEDFKFHI